MITIDMQIAGMEASLLGRPSVDDESYVVSIYEAMERAAWIDVKDSLPDVSTPVIVFLPVESGGNQCVAEWDGVEWGSGYEYIHRDEITHWRPMPSGPESLK